MTLLYLIYQLNWRKYLLNLFFSVSFRDVETLAYQFNPEAEGYRRLALTGVLTSSTEGE
jgi:hypothetical protein